jgi:hypothetical protein
MAPPQQKSRQGEEHRHGEVEATEQTARDTTGMAGLKGHVRNDHARGRAGAHTLDGGEEAADSTQLLAIGHDPSLPALCCLANRVLLLGSNGFA